MIHHLVMMRFKPGVGDDQIGALEAILDDLPNRIIEIHLYEFGRDLLHAKRSYDFGLSALFANLEALQRYQRHPGHLAVLEKIKELCEDVVTVDFRGSEVGGNRDAEATWNRDPFNWVRF